VDERAVGYLRTLLFAALLGVPVAIAAVLFQTAVHDVSELVWTEIPTLSTGVSHLGGTSSWCPGLPACSSPPPFA
jgi:hypothetical protein